MIMYINKMIILENSNKVEFNMRKLKNDAGKALSMNLPFFFI